MFDLFQSVNGGAYIETGVVDGFIGENVYRVKIGSRFLKVTATVNTGQLNRGANVVINRTEAGRYIVGTTKQLKSQSLQEVIIDG